MKRFVCAFDPDITASGVAVWDQKEKAWHKVIKVPIEDTLGFLSEYSKEDLIIYVEAGYLNKKANFRRGHKFSVSEEMAMRVGQNHAVGKITVRMLRKAGYEVFEVRPLKKGFMKNDSGWTPAGRKHLYEISGLTHKIGDDQKDAILLACAYR